ncbi:sensor histidine kinase [Thalassotalea agarivorans]|uniref:histidine kinase n=1 Tax=Thalassotalea agarivorans TaxID=349064 RepID=A0A1I0AJM2_THASX|nr:HAMP domain-containing sensor histidine kinase [Thalassotalea agarivorans]SES93869.1 Signal transduction histidine kinase [Thalassotalea agarivorans]
MSLYQRLAIALCLVFLLVASVFYITFIFVDKNLRDQGQQQLHLSLAASLVRDNPVLQNSQWDAIGLKNLFHTQMVLGPAFEFYLLDADGNVVTHSYDDSLIMHSSVDLYPIKALTQNLQPLPIYGRDPRSDEPKIFSAAPIFHGSQLSGYVYVIVAGQQYQKVLEHLSYSSHTTMLATLIVIALLLLFGVMLALFRSITRPIKQLANNMQQLAMADFDIDSVPLMPWRKNSSNEIDQLGLVYNDMAERIHSQISQLQHNDQERKNMLSQISHDLRTPLASMQGYVELMLLDEGMEKDKQQRYLKTVYGNTQQLNQLIHQIFELAYLEAGHVTVNEEGFNLIELLYDVKAKFAPSLENKNIRLNISPESGQIVLTSDIAKLERVLTNLIENAIRHSDSGSEILLAATAASTVSIVLTDFGTGIPPQDIDYIFEPRYRASNAVDCKEKHFGLGLAITKQLVQLLGGQLSVSSEMGKGTQFTLVFTR